jgi:carbonic anhydrase
MRCQSGGIDLRRYSSGELRFAAWREFLAVPLIVAVDSIADILPAYVGTPVEWLLRYHNLGEALPPASGRAQLLVGMCMDDRKDLVIPNEFAFVLRAAGGHLREHAFDISYAVAIGGVTAIALLAHTDCGMVRVSEKRAAFVRGLVIRGGWDEPRAAEHFDKCVSRYEMDDAVEFVVQEAGRVRATYPALLVAPLLYRVEDDRLLQIVAA